jgi:amino acid efflux transporter
MANLKKELGLAQGVGLLSTSLLGSGVFAVPALVALQSGGVSLWAWPLLLLLFFPVALTFAALGRRFPSAGGAAHFVGTAFGARMAQVTGWLFLSVIPFGLPAVLQIASGFWQAAFGLNHGELLIVQIVTIVLIWLLGLKSAGSSANVQTLIAILVVSLIVVIWAKGGISVNDIPFSPLQDITFSAMFDALAIMFWCFVGIEAFAHLASEFRNPERDFPRALLIGLLIAGLVYWGCTVAVIYFHSYGQEIAAGASLPNIVVKLFGRQALWVACIIGYLACFASINAYAQSFARLVWSQAQLYRPQSWLARLSAGQAPANALTVTQLCCLVATLVVYFMDVSLDLLIVYANGIFIAVYLLCMLSGCRLLKGKGRVMAALGSFLSLLMLIMIGWKCLYAVGVFIALWLLQPHIGRITHRRA